MKYEYEAVSGDQSLFDMVRDSEEYSCILLNKKITSLFASNLVPRLDDSAYHLLAERKVTEKYIPKSGDVFTIVDDKYDHGYLLCLKSNDDGVAFEYLTKEDANFDSISTSVRFEFIRKHDDKAANPVNFTSEKYVPRVGDVFAVSSKDDGQFNPNVFHCVLNVGRAKNDGSGKYINAKCDNNGNVFASLHLEMNDFHLIHRPSTK